MQGVSIKELRKRIEALKLENDSTGLKQNALINKILNIIDEYEHEISVDDALEKTPCGRFTLENCPFGYEDCEECEEYLAARWR